MTVSAAISFAQGASTSAPGVSLIGVASSLVTASNGGNNTNVVDWLWEMIDVSSLSALPTGVVQEGLTPTYKFTPDASGGYLLHLVVFDQFGNFAEDFRVFQVPETSGRIIPPFRATDKSLNFIISSVMNTRGWSPFMEAYLREIDALAVLVGSGWQTVIDFDFSLQSNQVLASDGMWSIGGLSWKKENTSHESAAMDVSHNVGLVITPSTSGGSSYVSARTSPLLRLPLSAFLPSTVDFGTRIRIYVAFGASGTDHTSNAAGRIQVVGVDSDSTDFMLALGHNDVGLTGTPSRDFASTYAAGQTGTPNPLATAGNPADPNNKCLLWELDSLMGTAVRLSGHSSIGVGAGFPAASSFQMMMTGSIANLGFALAAHAVSDLGLVLTAGVQNGDTSFISVVQRIRVDIR